MREKTLKQKSRVESNQGKMSVVEHTRQESQHEHEGYKIARLCNSNYCMTLNNLIRDPQP